MGTTVTVVHWGRWNSRPLMNKFPKLLPASLILIYVLLFVCGSAINGRYCLHAHVRYCAHPQTASSPDSDHAQCQHDAEESNIEPKVFYSEDIPGFITSDCSTCFTLGQTSHPALSFTLSLSDELPCLVSLALSDLSEQRKASFFLARGPPSVLLQSS